MAAVGALLLGGALIGAHALRNASRPGDAVVRIATPSGTGAGFFVAGPDDGAYVATAFHLVASGDRALVERDVPAGDGRHFVEAYPETEVVAFDADADLAILRIRHVRGDRFRTLALAEEPRVNGEVRAYGFATSDAARGDLAVREGALGRLVRLPVIDRARGGVVREDAVEGLALSIDLEPGFLGGPTLDDDGKVVGVNVVAEPKHPAEGGQAAASGAVHVRRLRELLARIPPAAAQAEPTADQVLRLVARVEHETLALPLEERAGIAPHGFVAIGELGRLRALVDEIRRQERDAVPASADALSGRAAFGLWAAQLPGRALETHFAPAVQETLRRCERSRARLARYADAPSAARAGAAPGPRPEDGARRCDELALRPLAWDLVAAMLHWSGEPREFTVSALEPTGARGATHRAELRAKGIEHPVVLWVSVDAGELRLHLFDDDGVPYGVRAAAPLAATDVTGAWETSTPRKASARIASALEERRERLVVSVEEAGSLRIHHEVSERLFAVEGAFACNFSREIAVGLEQTFEAAIDGGVALGKPIAPARPVGTDAARCGWARGYRGDRAVVLKRLGDKLLMVRTDGTGDPESVELTQARMEVKQTGTTRANDQ
jgi:hypothetical protein